MYSRAKQQLIDVMNKVYPTVQLVHFFKVQLSDGTVFRDGYTIPEATDFLEAIKPTSLWYSHWLAEKKFTEVIRQKTSRDPQDGEIRIAFRPVVESIRVVFVDDVISETRANFLIETSPNNWQAHFLLSRDASYEEAKLIQRHLIESSQGSSRPHGDVGAASPVQARRFPELRFMHNTWCSTIDVDALLTVIGPAPSMKQTTIAQSKNLETNWTEEALKQLYLRLQGKRRDFSAIDMSFVVYLLSKELSEEFVDYALRLASPNLEARHPKTEDYLQRTINKAMKSL